MKDSVLPKKKITGKHFYNIHLKSLEFAFTGTAYFACKCSADKLTKTAPQSLALPNFMIPYLSHPCLLPKISCFHFIKPVGRRKVLVAGHSLFSEAVRVILFHFRQESCHKVTQQHIWEDAIKKVQRFPPPPPIHTEINTNIFVGNNLHVKLGILLPHVENSWNRNFFIVLFISCFPKLCPD